ncbi:MAG: hypothetical protein JNM13_07475 [Hyphomicrobiaceae bacterium]|nr:hypothetical protein [Hyphomicrobiaceae bacterium]
MPIPAIDIVTKLASKAHPNYVEAFRNGEALLAEYEVNTKLRLAHFMAQVMHESGALRIFVESGNYTAKNLGKTWDDGNWHKYFPNRAACVAMAAQCKIDGGEALFNIVYGKRMGNGPASSGDGWKYRGRGLMQTTGREHYTKFANYFGVDFVGDPDLIFHPDHALKPALAEWKLSKCNDAADQNDIELVTQKINGGQNGIADRRAWFGRIWPLVKDGGSVEKTIEYRVQVALNAAGFDCGKPDGVIGIRTRQAIMDFRAARGLPKQTDLAKITPDLAEALAL